MVKKEELKNTEFQDKEEKENSKVKQFFEKSKAFLMRFKDVKEPIFSAKLGPVLQSRIEIVYLAGLVILGVYALVALYSPLTTKSSTSPCSKAQSDVVFILLLILPLSPISR